jgi:hypothetical protein
MPKGISLHIGLNVIDKKHYGSENRLNGCVPDAKNMEALAEDRGFKPTVLLDSAGTSAAVLAFLDDAAARLQTDDILFLTYSGHGSQVPDKNNDEFEDSRDETWCLYDRQLVDDELYNRWAKFKPGVRILMLSDSCHSGTVSREMLRDLVRVQTGKDELPPELDFVPRDLPAKVRDQTYVRHQKKYDKIQSDLPSGDQVGVAASVLLISACQDNQTAGDAPDGGAFTNAMLRVWNAGKFRGGYAKLHKDIQRNVGIWQSPRLFTTGAPNVTFLRQQPFSV